jgi:hypothetical protein
VRQLRRLEHPAPGAVASIARRECERWRYRFALAQRWVSRDHGERASGGRARENAALDLRAASGPRSRDACGAKRTLYGRGGIRTHGTL